MSDDRNYFDEEYVKGMLYRYQDMARVRYEVKIKGEETFEINTTDEDYDKYREMVEESSAKKDNHAKMKLVRVLNQDHAFKYLENKITIEIQKLVKAIIYIYGYHRFEPFEDLIQAGMLACFPNYLKFNEKNGTAFNFFSLIAKRSLLNYTTRKKKHREVQSIEEKVNIRSPKYVNDIEFFVEDMERTLTAIVNENFLGKKRKKFVIIVAIICDYLKKNKKYIGKSDLYKFAGGYGMRSLDMREFIKDMKMFYPSICDLLEDSTDDDELYGIDNLEETTGQI